MDIQESYERINEAWKRAEEQLESIGYPHHESVEGEIEGRKGLLQWAKLTFKWGLVWIYNDDPTNGTPILESRINIRTGAVRYYAKLRTLMLSKIGGKAKEIADAATFLEAQIGG